MLNEIYAEFAQIEWASWIKVAGIVLVWIVVSGFFASRLFRLSGDEHGTKGREGCRT